MPLILPGNVSSALGTGYDVANSCRFNSADQARMNRDLGTATSRQKFTYSFWIKRAAISHSFVVNNAGSTSHIKFDSSHRLDFMDEDGNIRYVTNRLFRDVSAWYSIIIAVDTTQGTAGDRVKIYINGTQETSFSTSTAPDQNYNCTFNTAVNFKYGSYDNDDDYNLDAYLAEVVFIDGSQLAPTSFGEFDEDSPRIWKPKDVSGLTFGNNGHYLDFEDSSNLGNDANGGTDWTEIGLAATDQSTDTPTNNFATWNPLFRKGTTTPAFAEGNLKSTFDDGGANEFALTTFGVSAGKWYAEVKWPSNTGTAATATGILDMAYTGTDDPNNAVTNAFGYFGSGTKNVSGTASSYGDSYADNDIIGIAIDMDNNKLYFSKNGTFQDSGDPTSGSTGTGAISIVSGVTYGIFASDYNSQVAELNTGSPPFSISSGNSDANGYGNFEYSVPSGYLALCTKNLGSDGG